MRLGLLDVDQDVVVLRGPAVLSPSAVVIGPDDLVEEALPTEDRIQKHLAVMHLAVVDMEVQRPVIGQDPARLLQTIRDEPEIVVVDVWVAEPAQLDGCLLYTSDAADE